MSVEVIEWLRSPEGEAWSRSRVQSDLYTAPAPSIFRERGPVDPLEDPTGRPPLTPGQATVREAG